MRRRVKFLMLPHALASAAILVDAVSFLRAGLVAQAAARFMVVGGGVLLLWHVYSRMWRKGLKDPE